jgi:hypothetical protein
MAEIPVIQNKLNDQCLIHSISQSGNEVGECGMGVLQDRPTYLPTYLSPARRFGAWNVSEHRKTQKMYFLILTMAQPKQA